MYMCVKDIIIAWLCGILLASGVWASVMFPFAFVIMPTVAFGIITVLIICDWLFNVI